MFNNLNSIILAWFSTMAICTTGIFSTQKTFLGMIQEEFNGVRIGSLTIFIALVFFYRKYGRNIYTKGHWGAHIVSVIFAGCMLIGISYSSMGNWNFIFGSPKQFLIAAFVFLGFFCLFNVIISILYKIMSLSMTATVISRNFNNSFFSKHSEIIFFIIIAICWLPFLIAYLPGSVPHDGYYQINMALGINPLRNQHPWFVTFCYGILMRLGSIVSDNFGVFLIVFVLYLIQVFCYAEVCIKIRQWIGEWAALLSSVFFAIIPAFGAYAQAVIKDNIFSALFALYMVWCMDLYLTSKICKKDKSIVFKLIKVSIIGFLVCLTRNNGIYMALLSLFAMIFFVRKDLKKYIIISLCVVCLCYNVIQNYAYKSLNVIPTSIAEMLSIPFQQTARYLKEYPDDVTSEEYWNISAVLPFEELSDLYNPELSDPVKNKYRSTNIGELMRYFKSWYNMFLKHPNVYLEATFNNTYGYYYIFHNCDVMGTYQFYIKDEPVATGDLDIHYIMPEKLRKFISDYCDVWRKLPVLSQLINPGLYTWLLIFLAGYLIEIKQAKKLLLFVGPAVNVLVCLASPVNGLLRYALPLMACAPMIIFWSLKDFESEDSIKYG